MADNTDNANQKIVLAFRDENRKLIEEIKTLKISENYLGSMVSELEETLKARDAEIERLRADLANPSMYV
jgi:uncharacterized small protein (DUF1192 family)